MVDEAFRKRAAARAEIIPPRSARRGGYQTAGGQRRRSTRYYLARAEAYLDAADKGEISSADAARRVGMTKDLCEMFLSHKMLELHGQAEASDVTPAPDEEALPVIRPHRVKKVTVKRGTDKLGQPIDEKTVAIESSHSGDEDAETVAEIEAIT